MRVFSLIPVTSIFRGVSCAKRCRNKGHTAPVLIEEIKDNIWNIGGIYRASCLRPERRARADWLLDLCRFLRDKDSHNSPRSVYVVIRRAEPAPVVHDFLGRNYEQIEGILAC